MVIPASADGTARFRRDYRMADGTWSRCRFATRRVDVARLVMTITQVDRPPEQPSPAEISQELELVEKRHKAVFEASLDPLLLIDPEGHFVEASQGIEPIFGWTPSEILGEHFQRYLHEDDLGEAMDIWNRLHNGESVRAQLAALHRDGRSVPVQVSATSILLDGARYIVVVVRDLRETIEIRTALEKIEQRLARSEKLELVGRLAGGIAHDIHNMLTVVTGTAEVLLEEAHDECIRGDASAIKSAGTTAADLSRRLLEMGKSSSPNTRVDFRETLDALEPLLTRLLPDDVALIVDLEPDLPAVDLDAGALEQLLLNLVLNASQAIATAGTIELTVETTSLPSYGIQLAVEDDGVGMSEETVERVFEPLFTTKGDEGTGLGLSTVARIVEDAGGTCDVESEKGLGTCFTLRLPAADLDTRESQHEPTEAIDTSTQLQVLIVDDTPNALRYLERALSSQGCETRAVGSMRRALDLLDEGETFDIVVTDFHMPGGSGVELMESIHRSRPEVPVVFVTADQFFEPPPEAADLVRKPFTPPELMQAVARARQD
jgi:PAS domain S-box-containing protein